MRREGRGCEVKMERCGRVRGRGEVERVRGEGGDV